MLNPTYRPNRCVSLLLGTFAIVAYSAAADAATIPGYSATQPVLWLNADHGSLPAVGNQVTQWIDNGNGNPTLTTINGVSTVGTSVFPNGSVHNVVTFGAAGNSAFALTAAIQAATKSQALDIFIVGNHSAASSGHGEISFANFSPAGSFGYAAGLSDSLLNVPKFYTNGESSDTNAGLSPLGVGQYSLINDLISGSGKTQSVYTGGTSFQSATDAGTTGINYNGAEEATLGSLSGGFQFYHGNIAEVLVFNDTGLTPAQIAAEQLAVGTYLANNYFVPEPSTFVLCGLGAFALIGAVRRRKNQIGDFPMLRTTQRVALFVALVVAALINQTQAASLPTTGLLMGLGADQHVTVSSGVVIGWGDLNGGTQQVIGTVGSPTVGSLVTPNGTHPAINFNGGAGLTLNTTISAAMSVPGVGISTFVVADINGLNPQVSEIFVSNFSGNGSAGWASGISDGSADQTKWYNGHGGNPPNNLENTTGLTMTHGTAYLIAASTSASGSNASLFDGITTVPNSSTNTAINYNAGGQVGSIGYLSTGGQNLIGNIAEVLVYNNSTPGFDPAAVTAYLDQKYFLTTPEPSSFVLAGLALALVAGRTLARRRTSTTG